MMVGRSDSRTVGRKLPLTVRLAVAFLLAACQPQSRRLLLLDLALSDPVALDATARPWSDAGYRVEYRRFYPHLARADLARYHTLLLLGGATTPSRASDALRAGDLALLSEWVDGGGVVVLGYTADPEGGGGGGRGSLDRWLMNRWLGWQGAGITIGDDELRDTTQSAQGAFDPQPPVEPQRNLPLQDPGFDPFPAGRNHALLTVSDQQILARTTATAFVRPPRQKPMVRRRAAVIAASRLRDGLVIVVSRHALSALGPDTRPSTTPTLTLDDLAATRGFLVSLARWTRRPAEWARIPPPPAHARRPLVLSDAPRPVGLAPPLLAPPSGATLWVLPAPERPDQARHQKPLAWIGRGGLRIVWGHLAALSPAIFGASRQRGIDSLVAFLDGGGFNVLAGDAFAATLADSIHAAPWEREAVRNGWKQLGDALETTSLHWIPAVEPSEFRLPVDTAVQAAAADTTAAWCVLDPQYWAEGMGPSYRALARLAATRSDLIPAVALDLDPPGRRPSDDPLCDAAWRAALAGLPRDSLFPRERAERFAEFPPAVRYDSLLESGLLGRYYAALEEAVAARAAALRAELRRIRRDLGFAFISRRPPLDWYGLGLLRGFSAPEAPALLWTTETHTRELLDRIRSRGIVAVHAVGLAPGSIPAGAWPRLSRVVFGENDGFWIGPLQTLLSTPRAAEGRLSPDSLAQVIRRLTRALPPAPAAR